MTYFLFHVYRSFPLHTPLRMGRREKRFGFIYAKYLFGN